MAQIDISHDGLTRLVGRLTRELGDLMVGNFAIDEQLNLAILQVQNLVEIVDAKETALVDLRAKVESMGAEIDKLRLTLDDDPAHAHRYARAKRTPRHKKPS